MNKKYQNPGPLWVIWILNLALDLSLYEFETEVNKKANIKFSFLDYAL